MSYHLLPPHSRRDPRRSTRSEISKLSRRDKNSHGLTKTPSALSCTPSARLLVSGSLTQSVSRQSLAALTTLGQFPKSGLTVHRVHKEILFESVFLSQLATHPVNTDNFVMISMRFAEEVLWCFSSFQRRLRRWWANVLNRKLVFSIRARDDEAGSWDEPCRSHPSTGVGAAPGGDWQSAKSLVDRACKYRSDGCSPWPSAGYLL